MQRANENMTKKELLDYAQKLETSYNKTRQENEYLKFRISELQRLLYGSKRERFVSNETVGQKSLPFKDQIEQPAQEPKKKEKIEYYREKPQKETSGKGRFSRSPSGRRSLDRAGSIYRWVETHRL